MTTAPQAPDIAECLTVGWNRIQPQLLMLVLITLTVILLWLAAGFLTPGFMSLRIGPGFFSARYSVVNLIIQGPLMLGMFQVFRKAYKGQTVEFGDVFGGFQKFLPAFLNGLLFYLAVGIGLVLCVIPGIVAAGFLVFWPLVLEDGAENGVDALLGSIELVKPFWLPTVLFVLVAMLVKMVGLLACCVGVLLTAPIALMAIIHAYEMLRGLPGEAGEDLAPPLESPSP
jgi:hypothetical protein